uniref:Uncharacterized protein n=1 Tax=Odontella aurita TaxID=265563 RepID=A0A7S4IKG8_9STRA|mmetsp:Transcript_26409/g.78108  ORF Transcript_26409/g.78108 Transcript_26409/m.78108 type:complete len:344 (+) Transcript_26409:468-1499(+)
MKLRNQNTSMSFQHPMIVTSLFVSTLALALPAIVSAAFLLPSPICAFLDMRKPLIDTPNRALGQKAHAPSELGRQVSLKYKNLLDDGSVSDTFDRNVIKHPLFFDKNVHMQKFHIGSPKIWESILPQVNVLSSLIGVGGGRQLRKGLIGKDVTVEFREAEDGAKELLETCALDHYDKESEIALQYLTSVLSFYQEIVSYDQEKNRRCKARIVSTRGQVGSKCPRWHADHVPVRLVMSLIGPGCDFISETVEGGKAVDAVRVDREALNGLDADDTNVANRIIVPNENGTVHSSAGDAVLLMGREWEECDKVDSNEAMHLHAAVHKSPTLKPFEGRVLLVVDAFP